MEGIIPGPAGHAFVVISADPAQRLKVSVADVVLQLQELGCLDVELLPVVLLLVVEDLVAEDRIVLEVVLGVGQLLELLLEGGQGVGVIHKHLGL